MKKIFLFLLFLINLNASAQALNSYEFLVIPAKFDFQKQPDQYGTQSLMEAYFKQKGYNVIREELGLPTSVNSNRCLAIYVAVEDKSSMFVTKTKVFLKDCSGKILVQSAEGISNEKQYDLIYKQIFRAALSSMADQNYKFESSTQNADELSKKVIVNATSEKISPKPLANDTVIKTKTINTITKYQTEILSNGFLLIDKVTAKVFLKLYKTSKSNIFITKMNENSGIATLQNNSLVIEYIDNNVLKTENIAVDF